MSCLARQDTRGHPTEVAPPTTMTEPGPAEGVECALAGPDARHRLAEAPMGASAKGGCGATRRKLIAEGNLVKS